MNAIPAADDLIHQRRWKTLAVLCLSLVMVVAGVSSLNVALPAISSALEASGTELQWMVDAYSLSFAALLLPAGALGDRFGRKGALQIGLLIYAGSALLGSLVDEPGQLIATRAAMGVGAAFVMPATLSIITHVFPPHERGKAIATWAGFAGAGGAIGPLLSGVLLESYWWGSVLFISVPLAGLALGLGFVFVPTSVDPDHTRLDPGGAILSAGGLFLILYAIIEGPNYGWTDVVTLGAFGLGSVVLVWFVLWERASSAPMLDLAFFSNRGFRAGSFTITIVFFCLFGMFFLVTLYLQFAIGFSALGAAVRTVPIAVMMLLVAPRSAALAERFGLRNVVTSGMVLMSAGFVVMASLANGYRYWTLLTSLVLLGAGMSVVMANSTTAIMAGLPLAKAGVGSAVNDTSREVGGAVGIAVLGSIVSTVYRGSLGDSLAALPEPAAAAVDDSIGGALRAAQLIGGETGQQLAVAARSAFTDAFGITMLSAAAVVLIGAMITARSMPEQVAVASTAPAPEVTAR